MSVHLVPDKELHFHRPFTHPTKRTLTITNENAIAVAFKVKVTAPKLYIVIPATGRIEPGNSIGVTVTLLAMKEQPPLSARCRDKFIVQSIFIRSKDTTDIQSLWNVPNDVGDEWKIHSQKLTIMYLPPLEDGESTGPDEIPKVASTESKHLPSAIFPRFTQSKAPWVSSSASASPPAASPPSSQLDSSNRDELRNKSRQSTGAGIVNANLEPSLPPAPGPTTQGKQDLVQQLGDAQEEIRHLRALLARLDDGASSATDADRRTRTSTPKSLASGVESMMATLRNFVQPVVSSAPTIDSLGP